MQSVERDGRVTGVAPDFGSTPTVVETQALTKRFGNTTVVSNVDLGVPRGMAFGYLSPNGASETILIRMLLGLSGSTSGSMKLLGLPVPAKRSQALARVGVIVDEPRFHAHMTGRQNLWALAAACEPESHARIDAAVERVGLRERAGDRVSKYSMGMSREAAEEFARGDPFVLNGVARGWEIRAGRRRF